MEYLPGLRPLAGLARVNQYRLPGVRPLSDLVLVLLDCVGQLGLHRIAIRHLDGRRQHLGQAHRAVLGQHGHQSAGGAGSDRRERSELRRKLHALAVIKLRRRAGGCNTQGVDTNHFAGVGVVDQRLRLATPGQRVPHGGSGGDHRACGVDCVAALLEDHGSGGRGQRLAGDSHPVTAVQRRFLCLRDSGLSRCERDYCQAHCHPKLPKRERDIPHDSYP